MSQIWNNDMLMPVTLIEAGPCIVTQVKTKEKDGYQAVQVGFDKLKEGKARKDQKGKEFRNLKEFVVEDVSAYNVGDEINLSSLTEGQIIDIKATAKGKGYQGPIKRFHTSGLSKTHGTKSKFRSTGSIGCRWPQRVIKGKKMAGRMGSETITTKNLTVVKIDNNDHILAVRGAIPGRPGTIVQIFSKN